MPVSDSSAKILIVDDEPNICRMIERWLIDEGYSCMAAFNGEEAWEVLSREAFSLMVTDITMPGLSGMELLEKARKRFPDVAVIMVTAVDDRDTAIRALQLGAYGYVIKPFGKNEVVIDVANALERRRLTLASEEYEHRLEEQVRERTTELRSAQEEVTLRLVSAAEYRDEETGAHIKRIGLYAAALAQAVGWDPDRAADIKHAAPMHDIGKIGVPDSILLKPGKLTEQEFEVIKRHTVIGAGILEGSRIPLLTMARDIALGHHERWDGSGYPHGSTGDATPESARIVAIVDAYDALTTERVYRAALPEPEALDIMEQGQGTHFNPRILDAFLSDLPRMRQIREEHAA